MNIKLRIWQDELMKELTVKKNITLRELSEMIMNEFEIRDVNINNFRLRTYDTQLKVKITAHQQMEMQLHKLNFHSYMNLQIETRNEGELFEEFDEDTLFIRVVKHVEGETYDFKALDKLPCQVMRVNKKRDLVSDLD